jgi:hypothetical protein
MSVTTSGSAGSKPRSRSIHVDRVQTASGWRTTYSFPADPLFAGLPGSDHRLARLDIDEAGNGTATAANGSIIDFSRLAGVFSSPATIVGRFPEAQRTAALSRIMAKGPPTPGPIHVRTSWIDPLFRDEVRRTTDLAQIGRAFTLAGTDASGASHFTKTLNDHTIDLTVDPLSGVIEEQVSGSGGPLWRTTFSYAHAPDGITVRTGAVVQFQSASEQAGHSIQMALSHVTVNGQEIRP